MQHSGDLGLVQMEHTLVNRPSQCLLLRRGHDDGGARVGQDVEPKVLTAGLVFNAVKQGLHGWIVALGVNPCFLGAGQCFPLIIYADVVLIASMGLGYLVIRQRSDRGGCAKSIENVSTGAQSVRLPKTQVIWVSRMVTFPALRNLSSTKVLGIEGWSLGL